MSSMIFQIVILILALGMVSPHGPVDVGHDLDWVYVLFIGIQGGAQVTMVRLLLPSCSIAVLSSLDAWSLLHPARLAIRRAIEASNYTIPLLNVTNQLTSRPPTRALASFLRQ